MNGSNRGADFFVIPLRNKRQDQETQVMTSLVEVEGRNGVGLPPPPETTTCGPNEGNIISISSTWICISGSRKPRVSGGLDGVACGELGHQGRESTATSS